MKTCLPTVDQKWWGKISMMVVSCKRRKSPDVRSPTRVSTIGFFKYIETLPQEKAVSFAFPYPQGLFTPVTWLFLSLHEWIFCGLFQFQLRVALFVVLSLISKASSFDLQGRLFCINLNAVVTEIHVQAVKKKPKLWRKRHLWSTTWENIWNVLYVWSSTRSLKFCRVSIPSANDVCKDWTWFKKDRRER